MRLPFFNYSHAHFPCGHLACAAICDKICFHIYCPISINIGQTPDYTSASTRTLVTIVFAKVFELTNSVPEVALSVRQILCTETMPEGGGPPHRLQYSRRRRTISVLLHGRGEPLPKITTIYENAGGATTMPGGGGTPPDYNADDVQFQYYFMGDPPQDSDHLRQWRIAAPQQS